MTMSRSLIIYLFLVISLINVSQTNAQGMPVGSNSLEITSSNDSPAPGQNITLTVRSYSIDIHSSTVTWLIDGKLAQKGTGLTTLDLNAPPLGKEYRISVSALSTKGVTVSNSFVVGSGSLDIIIEHNGYTPPLFKGKVPISYQNNVKIIAIPHVADSKGVIYDPKTLVYQWKKNSRAVEDQSGYGKQVFTLIGDIVPRANTINVTVSTKDGINRVSGYTIIDYNSPSLSFYIDDPLYGTMLNKSVTETIFIGSEKETSVLMIPYGFTKPINELGNLLLTWMINGYEKPELQTNQSITLRAPENSEGSSNVELTVRNKTDILQSASASFSARFNSRSNTSNTTP